MFRHLYRVPLALFLPLIIVLQLISGKAAAQLDPVPQALPYSPDFSVYNGSYSFYVAGFNGWNVPGTLSSTVLTAAPTTTVNIFTGETNAVTSAFIGDMVGKIGMLSDDTHVKALCLAVNTTSVTSGNIQLIYTIATQGQTAGGRIDEMDLQYRIGTSGSFTTVAGAIYQNDALTTTTTTTTTAYNGQTLYITLPAACNNHAAVELRWIPRSVSGSGNHPSFSITNITVQAKTTTDYYCLASGNLDNVTTWGTNTDGTGTHPANFTAAGGVFHIVNGNPGNLSANWTVSGTNSKIIVDRSDLTTSTSKTISAVIDVNASRTLTFSNIADSSSLVLNALDPSSTVIFSGLSNFPVPLGPVYGNIVFNNTTNEVPVAVVTLTFAGNFTMLGTSAINGVSLGVGSGMNLTTYGSNDQVINTNGLPLTIWDFDLGHVNPKSAGTVSLAPGTIINANNTFWGSLTGSAVFADNGNIIEVGNNLDLAGSSSNYSLTGTIWFNGILSGTQVIRGGSGPLAAQLNNIVFNSIYIKARIANGNIVVKGDMVITDTATHGFDFMGYSVALGGNFINRNPVDLITMGTPSTINFNGTSQQSYTSAVPGGTSFYSLTMNNSSGLILNNTLNLAGVLTLNNGVITAADTLSMGAGGGVSGGNAGSYVNGNFSQYIAAGTGVSKTYQLGDTTYSPITLTFPGAISFGGSVLAKSAYGPHPAMATSYISTTNDVNRYWTVANQSLTGYAGTVNVAFSYNAGDMTGPGNSGYVISKYTAAAWANAPSVTDITTGVAPLLPYVSKTTGLAGGAFSGDFVAGSPDCATTAGTATVSPSSICGSGTAVLGLTGTTSNTGNTYQWQSSPTGSGWVAISGATSSTYSATGVSATTYYRCSIGCIPTTTSVNSLPAIVTVNPLPSPISGTLNTCAGTSQTLTDASGGGTWSSSNTGIVTIGSSSGTYVGPVAGTATISYTLPTGCYATATVSNLTLPNAPPLAPLLLSFCATSGETLLTTSADTITGTVSFTNNTTTFLEPKYNPDTSSIIVSGIPPGAIITSASVNFTVGAVSTALQKENIYNLRAPNGNRINLINNKGSSTGTGVGSFDSVTISSTGTTPIVLGTPVVPGVQYAANLAFNAGLLIPSAYKSNTTSWANLYSVPNGQWTFITDNTFNANDDTFKRWTLTLSYVLNPIVTWAPVTGLFTNSSGTAYTAGISTDSIYVLPTATTIYTVSVTSGYCSNSTSIPAIYANPLYVPSVQGQATICQGASVTMTDSLSGGTWSSSNTSVVTIGSATGIMTGTGGGTATISYSYANGGCSGMATKVVSVTLGATPIIGNLGVCVGFATQLSDASAGTWSISNTNASIGTSGIVTGLTPGLDTVTYSSPTGCPATGIVSVNAMPTLGGVSASSNTLCAGGTFMLNAVSASGTGSPVSYNWSGPGGYIASGTSASALVTPATTAGSGIYSLSVTYPGVGCVTSVSAISPAVTVNVIPTVTGVTASTSQLCAGGTFTLTAGTASGIGSLQSYNWSGPGGYNTTGTLPTAVMSSVTTAGSGVYSLSVTYPGSGCTSSASVTSPAVSVNAAPTVSGISSSAYLLCTGATFTLTAGATTGTGSLTSYNWSGPNGYSATSATGAVVLTASTTAVSGVYSLTVNYSGIGCISAAPVTSTIVSVNAVPTVAGITASANRLCIGGSFTLTAGTTTGTGSLSSYNWSGPNGYTATGTTVSAVVTPATTASSGIYSLSVTYPGIGCVSSATTTSPAVTVNAIPTVSGLIASTNSLCAGGSFTLTAGATAGIGSITSYNWSGPNGFITSGAISNTVVSGTSVSSSGVYSLSVTYPGAGCTSTISVTSAAVTVNVQPAAITGSPSLCNGTTTLMSDSPAGGAWTVSNGHITIDGSGTVTGVSLGSTTITYTIGSCFSTMVVTVNAAPPPISGTGILCLGVTTTLSDLQSGGTWASGSSSVSIDGSGNITGNTTGTAEITYSLGGSCATVSVVTVNALPTITGLTSSSSLLCAGANFTLTAGAATGTGAITSYNWSGPAGYSSTSIAGTEAVTAATTASGGIYSVIVNYTGTGCTSAPSAIAQAVTVNPVPSSSGATTGGAICYGGTADLFANSANATSWTWVGPGGYTSTLQDPAFTATATGTYSLSVSSIGTGCNPSTSYPTTVTVNPLPGSISGIDSVYIGSFVTLGDDTTGGIWSSANSNVTVGSLTGIVSGVASGTAVITYALGTGCTATFVMTVLAVPPAITGTLNVCPGSAIILSDLITGGTWTSSNANASVGSASGIVTGVSAGTSMITYTFPSSTLAVYAIVTIDPLPSAILGSFQVCSGLTTVLSDTSSVGSWSSSNANASVGTATGIVTGVTPGMDTISYTISATGCAISAAVTVNALPSSILGAGHVCLGLSTFLSDVTASGTWSSSNGNATIGSTGLVTGSLAGTSTITYELGTGCINTTVVTVNPLPNAISGLSNVCVGSMIALSDSGAGSWSSSNANASVNSAGSVSGIAAGTSEITFTLPTGCISTMAVTVNPIVIPSITIVQGTHDTVCSGTPILLTTTSINGGISAVYQWEVNHAPVPGAISDTFSYHPVNGDTVTIILTSDTTCALPATVSASDVITVIPADTGSIHITATPGDTVCQGAYAAFTALAVNGGTAPIFIWSVNGVEVATGASYAYLPSTSDNIFCTLVSNQRCVVADTARSNHITMQVDTSYIPVVAIFATPGNTISPVQADTFLAEILNPGPAVAYQWFINTTPIPGATTATFSASDFANNDSVSCFVTGTEPCSYNSFNSVKIHIVYTGVQQIASGTGNIRLVPNPNKGSFVIKGELAVKNDEDVSAEITDMLGQVVYKSTISSRSGIINEPVSLGDGLVSGMYLLNLRSGSENIVFHFVIAQ